MVENSLEGTQKGLTEFSMSKRVTESPSSPKATVADPTKEEEVKEAERTKVPDTLDSARSVESDPSTHRTKKTSSKGTKSIMEELDEDDETEEQKKLQLKYEKDTTEFLSQFNQTNEEKVQAKVDVDKEKEFRGQITKEIRVREMQKMQENKLTGELGVFNAIWIRADLVNQLLGRIGWIPITSQESHVTCSSHEVSAHTT